MPRGIGTLTSCDTRLSAIPLLLTLLLLQRRVGMGRVELPRVAPHGPEPCASANSATSPNIIQILSISLTAFARKEESQSRVWPADSKMLFKRFIISSFYSFASSRQEGSPQAGDYHSGFLRARPRSTNQLAMRLNLSSVKVTSPMSTP